jgi:putative ABC transport system ATP-binding protein
MASNGNDIVVRLKGIGKVYASGALQVTALEDINVEVARGEMVAITGPSGSGKSTLMNVLGCLDRPSSGVYELGGRNVARMGDDDLAAMRNRFLGFIFQNYNLLPLQSAQQNVELPLIYRGMARRARHEAARAALAAVGLSDRMHHRPAELSGGQQQRVAIARALAAQPEVLLGDEPTGNLDSRTGTEIMALIQRLNEQGLTVIMVTHDPRIARHCRRVVSVADGHIVGDEQVTDRLIAQPGAAEPVSA